MPLPLRENGLCNGVLYSFIRRSTPPETLIHSVRTSSLYLFYYFFPISFAAVQLARELIDALSYLHERNMSASFLCPESVLFNNKVVHVYMHLFIYGIFLRATSSYSITGFTTSQSMGNLSISLSSKPINN